MREKRKKKQFRCDLIIMQDTHYPNLIKRKQCF